MEKKGQQKMTSYEKFDVINKLCKTALGHDKADAEYYRNVLGYVNEIVTAGAEGTKEAQK